jgi:hypothetical protein
MTISIVDTSVLVELLAIPGFRSRHDETLTAFAARSGAGERFLLAVPVILETGNHVAQLPDGGTRRKWAVRFVEFIGKALSGESPDGSPRFGGVGDGKRSGILLG